MPIDFDQLLALYRNTEFGAHAEGVLTIASPAVLAIVQTIEENKEREQEDANFGVLTDAKLGVGQRVKVAVGSPRLSLGLLVRSVDDLLNSREARLSEPRAYFVVENAVERGTVPPPELIERYRLTLKLMELFSASATYVDRTRMQMVFLTKTKLELKINYDSRDLQSLPLADANALLAQFADELHHEQKLALLQDAIARLAESQPLETRLSYVLNNIGELTEEVRNGYRLFVSSFSYSKIRSEVEGANAEYLSKVHKTLTDIQGQVLGLPIATIVVASQMKPANDCGVALIANLAVLLGAWLFCLLLLISIANQWLTLSSIAGELSRQRKKLVRDYAAVSDQFIGSFDAVRRRITWHRCVLGAIAVIAILGSVAATCVYGNLTDVKVSACFAAEALPPAVGVPDGDAKPAEE